VESKITAGIKQVSCVMYLLLTTIFHLICCLLSIEDIVNKRKKTRTEVSALTKLLETKFPRFESRDRDLEFQLTDYGISNNDLTFKDVVSIDNKW